MGLLSAFFKPKPKKAYYIEGLGNFELVFSKRQKHLWTNNSTGWLYTIRGTGEKPDIEQAEFLKNVEDEIRKLHESIMKKFHEEFSEADMDHNFNHWNERFKIVSVDIMMIYNKEAYWNIAFEDLKSPFATFTLFFEGQKPTDFSIDT